MGAWGRRFRDLSRQVTRSRQLPAEDRVETGGDAAMMFDDVPPRDVPFRFLLAPRQRANTGVTVENILTLERGRPEEGLRKRNAAPVLWSRIMSRTGSKTIASNAANRLITIRFVH